MQLCPPSRYGKRRLLGCTPDLPGANAHEHVLHLISALVKFLSCVGEAKVILLPKGVRRSFFHFTRRRHNPVLDGS